MLDRTIRPQSKGVEFLGCKQPEYSVLPNGVKMYSVDISSTELVRVDFMFSGGQWTQRKPLQAGMAYKLIKEGTRLYPHDVIAERLDYYGAVVDAGVNMSYGRIGVTCLSKLLPEVLPIVLDMIMQPVFSPDKLNLSLSQAKVSYDVSMQTVGEQCKRLFYRGLFEKRHPMSQFPEASDYTDLTVEDLQKYVSLNLGLENLTVFLTGTLSCNLVELVSNQIGQIQINRKVDFGGFEALGVWTPKVRRSTYEMQIPTVQACLRMGCRAVQRTHPDYIQLMVLTTLLGGYFGSRLMTNIREEKGLTYDISASLYQTPQTTLFSIKTETQRESVELVVAEVYKEMERLVNERPSEAELIQVKNYILGYMCRAYETNFNLSLRLMNLCSNGLSLSDIEVESSKVLSITTDDVLATAQRYFLTSDMIECVAL